MEKSLGKVLVVEDESKLARFIELELRHEGYDVVLAGRQSRDRKVL